VNETAKDQNRTDDAATSEIRAVRRRLVETGLLWFGRLAPLAVVFSLARISQQGWHPIFVVHIGIGVIAVTGAILRKRLSYGVCACLLLGNLLVAGVVGLVVYGLVGGGIMLLSVFAIMTAIALGTRSGLVAGAISAVVIALVGSLVVVTGVVLFPTDSGEPATAFHIGEYAMSARAWSLSAVAFLMTIVVIIVALSVVHKHLATTLQDLREGTATHERLVGNLVETFLYRHNVEGNFTYVSPSITGVLGYEPKEFMTHFSEYLTDHPVNQDVEMHTAEGLSGVQRPPYELQIYHKDGSTRWLQVSESSVRGDEGTVVAMEGVAHDITDRKRREDSIAAELRLSGFAIGHSVDDLLQAFLDETERLTDSEIGFYHFVEADQVTLTLHAWSTNTLEHLCKAEGKGSHYPIDQAGVWVDCVREGRPVIHNDYASLPHRKGMPDGHAPVIRELVVPVYRGGKIVAILGVGNKKTDYDDEDVKIVSDLANMAWDIVGRIRAEEALQASEALLNESQAIAGVGSWERDLINDRLIWSDETYRILGLSPENFEPVYETFLAAVHPDDRAIVDEAYLGSAREGKDHYEIEHRIVRGDTGAVRYVREECKHLRDASGKLVRSVGMIQDITERREIEEELARSSELKSKFIQVAGHELRTPLSYIMAVPKLMEPVEDAAKLKSAIRKMETKARRLSEIVQSMFKLMPEEGYGEQLNLKQVALSEILERVHADCRPFVEERRQHLEVQQEDGIPLLLVDPHKIHDVIENLLGNAVKFTPEGGTIRVAALRAGDGGVQVTVTDQGPGISPSDLPNIFTPFYSTEDVLKHTSGSIGKMKHGMGLGLTVVKHFTEMHGGTVTVTTDGSGSTFTITLPLTPPGR